MSDKLQIANPQMAGVSEEKTASAPNDQIALLKDVIARIRHDSAKASREYLDETTVPHGGE